MDIALYYKSKKRSEISHRKSRLLPLSIGFVYVLSAFLIILSIATSPIALAFEETTKQSSSPEAKSIIQSNLLTQTLTTSNGFTFYQAVDVKTNENYVSHFTKETQVSKILDELEISYTDSDIVTPSLDKHISNSTTISIVKVTNEKLVETEVIPFETIYIEDEKIPFGQTKTVQAGQNGELSKVFELVYNDGQLVSKTQLEDEITVQPLSEIIAKGTKSLAGSCTDWGYVVDNTTSDPYERSWLKFIMMCESGCNATRVSRSGNYHGLLQFSISTFKGYDGVNIYSGEEQIKIAHTMYTLGGMSAARHHFRGCTDAFLRTQ